MRVELPLIAALVLTSAFARADAIYLQGGRVLEGNATEDGDKVTVELESGRMSFARSEVVRIERGTSPLQEVDRREKKLARDDSAGTLELANYCREHGLTGRERLLLERILAREPEHAEVRRRLGYVREGKAWVLRSEQLRKERLVQAERRESELARKREQLELEEATARRDRAQAELKQAQLQLARERNPQVTPPTWYSPVVSTGSWNPRRAPLHAPSPSAGSTPFSNGQRSPQSYWDDAYRSAYGRSPPR
jgi:hypothetical protein